MRYREIILSNLSEDADAHTHTVKMVFSARLLDNLDILHQSTEFVDISLLSPFLFSVFLS